MVQTLEYLQKQRATHETADGSDNPKDDERGLSIILSNCFPYARFAAQPSRQGEQNGDEHLRNERSVRRSTVWIACFTVVLGLSAIIGTGISIRTLWAIEDQLETMQSDKRAWIKLDVSIDRYVVFTDWDKAKFINVPLIVKMRNYGDAPARNITIQIAMREHPGNPKRNELDVPQQALCDLANKEASDHPFAGISVFPNDSQPHAMNIGAGVGYDKANAVLVSLFGCVDYTFSNERHGQTAFRFLIGKIVGDSIMGLPFIEGTTIPNDIPDPVDGPARVARLPVEEFYFGADDGGNYAR